jgi:hypothetical protein
MRRSVKNYCMMVLIGRCSIKVTSKSRSISSCFKKRGEGYLYIVYLPKKTTPSSITNSLSNRLSRRITKTSKVTDQDANMQFSHLAPFLSALLFAIAKATPMPQNTGLPVTNEPINDICLRVCLPEAINCPEGWVSGIPPYIITRFVTNEAYLVLERSRCEYKPIASASLDEYFMEFADVHRPVATHAGLAAKRLSSQLIG